MQEEAESGRGQDGKQDRVKDAERRFRAACSWDYQAGRLHTDHPPWCDSSARVGELWSQPADGYPEQVVPA